MLSKIKDKTISKAIQVVIDSQIKKFGKMLKFNLDSKNKKIELEVMLDGEKEPLNVKINNYEIKEAEGKYHLIAKDITTSKKWINVIISEYLNEKKLEIPSKYLKILKLII